MWDYDSIGNEIAMKMMLIDGIREPTLTQVQENSEKSIFGDDEATAVPAWMYFAEPHPGLPEHYYTVSSYKNDRKLASSIDDDLQFPQLPFSLVNREINYKLLISLKESELPLPPLRKLTNGSIVITSNKFSTGLENETEIFLDIQDKLLPCYFTTCTDDVIIDSPLTTGCRVRCYYLVIKSAVTEVTFINSKGKVIYRCDYQEIWLHGSTSYHQISKAVGASS